MEIPLDLLHIPTFYVTAGFLYILVSFAAWLMLKNQGTQAPTIWCVGGGVMGVGIILLGFRAWTPLSINFMIGNSLLILGNLLHIQSLSKELGGGLSRAVLLGIYLGVMIPFLYLLLVLQTPLWRFVWNMQCLALLCGWTAWLGMRIAVKESNKSAIWLAAVYALLFFTMSSRGWMPLLGWAPPDPLRNDWSGLWIIVGVVIASVIGNVAIIGLYLERAIVRNKQFAREREEQSTATMLSEQVSDQYRKSSLDEMSDALAHELGQPITGVLFDCNMLKLRCAKLQVADPQILGSLASLNEQATRIRDIIDNLRKLSDRGETSFEVLNLWDVLGDVQRMVRVPVRQQRLNLEFVNQTPSRAVFVMGNRVLLSLVFINLLRNAMEAREPPAQTRVSVSLSFEASQIRVLVEDDGPGFTSEALSRIDTGYFTTKEEGSGVGLILCRRIAEQHNGTLKLRSGLTLGGAAIEIRLPAWPG